MKTQACLVATLLAAVVPHPTFASDPRIRQVAYDPKSVTTLQGCFGLQSTVAFAPGEQIENVALGDAHSAQAEMDGRLRGNGVAVIEADEVDRGARR